MHITLEADYAVRIVIFLAQRRQAGESKKRADASTISQHTGVSLRFALKILRNLVTCGIARSFKGTQGGYELEREPSDITLRELLEAVEGEYVFSRCLTSTSCTKPNNTACKVQKVFHEVSMLVRQKLESVTVEQLM